MAEITKELLEKLLEEQTKTTFRLNREYFDQKFEPLAASIAEDHASLELQISRLNHRIEELENRVMGHEQGTSSRLNEILQVLEDVQNRLKHVATQSLEDTYVEAKDITRLQKRISKLEYRITQLEPKHTAK
ncbi:MAG: hypothetical protein M3Q64_00195 [bacterium]|nr:hypothetical protein [bacterium]